MLHNGRERDRPVEPGHGEDHVIVRRECTEAELRRSLRVGDEMIEGVRMTPEIHQRKVNAEIHRHVGYASESSSNRMRASFHWCSSKNSQVVAWPSSSSTTTQ